MHKNSNFSPKHWFRHFFLCVTNRNGSDTRQPFYISLFAPLIITTYPIQFSIVPQLPKMDAIQRVHMNLRLKIKHGGVFPSLVHRESRRPQFTCVQLLTPATHGKVYSNGVQTLSKILFAMKIYRSLRAASTDVSMPV